MSFGESPYDAQLMQSWETYCDKLKEAGRLLFKDGLPTTPLERAGAFRFLMQVTGLSFELDLENRQPDFPAFTPYFSPTRKFAGDNADAYYLHAYIDPSKTYRIYGRRGTARFVNFSVHGRWIGPIAPPWGDVSEAGLTGDKIKVEPDGSFCIIVGPKAPTDGGNYIPTTPDSQKIQVRQFYEDWEHEQALEVRIEELNRPKGAPPLPTPAQVQAAMEWAGDYVVGQVRSWPETMLPYVGPVNTIVNRQETRSGNDQVRGRTMVNAKWSLGRDEAMIIAFRPPPGLFWTLDIETFWHQTMDYRWRYASINSANAVKDGDQVFAIVADRDLGMANWLDTSGHRLPVLSSHAGGCAGDIRHSRADRRCAAASSGKCVRGFSRRTRA